MCSKTIYIFTYNDGKIIKSRYHRSGIKNANEKIPKDDIYHEPISSFFDLEGINDIHNLKNLEIPVDNNLSHVTSEKIKYIKLNGNIL